MDGFRGILAYTLPEALWLASQGTSDDIVVAYPTADRAALARLAADPAAASVDHRHGGLHRSSRPDRESGSRDRRARSRSGSRIDIDAWLPGARRQVPGRRATLPGAHARAMRSRSPRSIMARPGLRLTGLMAYEAQIAGVGDNPPGRPLVRPWPSGSCSACRRPNWPARRAAIVAAIRALTPLEFVNGGGTGSLERTAAEAAVTEIGAGSGLYHPTLVRRLPRLHRPPGGACSRCRSYAAPGRGVVTASRRRLSRVRAGSAEPGAVALPAARLAPGPGGGRRGGADSAARRRRRQPARRRPGVDAARQGGRAVRAVQRAAPDRRQQRSAATVPTYRGEGQTFL